MYVQSRPLRRLCFFPMTEKTPSSLLLQTPLARVAIDPLGARLSSLVIRPAPHVEFVTCVVGNAPGTAKNPLRMAGAIIGRTANRWKEWPLHGGPGSLHHREWSILHSSASSVVLTLDSPHLENGYPGHLSLTCSYTLHDAELRVVLEATLKNGAEKTPFSPTHHPYFSIDNAPGPKHSLTIYQNGVKKPFNIPTDIPTDLYVPCSSGPDGVLAELHYGSIRLGIGGNFPGVQVYCSAGMKDEGFAPMGALCVEPMHPVNSDQWIYLGKTAVFEFTYRWSFS